MKKTIYLLLFLASLLGISPVLGQVSSIVVSPQTQCYSAGSNTSQAYVSPGIPGATSYQWVVASPNCTAAVSTFSNGVIASIFYPCCGVYTIAVTAYSGNTVLGTMYNTANIVCYTPLNTTVIGGVSCAGSPATITASGANSYTWSNGMTGPSIVVSPTASTCYTVIGYTSSGCISSAVRCITVSPSPVITVSGNSTICAGSGATLTASGASTYTWLTAFGTFTGSTIVLSPTATTCYSVLASNNGCFGATAGCVVVSQMGPNPVISSNNFNICAGSSATLTASGASSYTWFPMGTVSSSIVVTPSTTTCYTLIGYSCFQTASAVRCVTVGTGNVPITVTGNNTVCAGNGATLTASGASTYTWYTAMGTFTGSTIVLAPTATSCYSLVGRNANGCMGYTGGCVYVSNTAPNPVISSNNFNICTGSSATLTASGATSYTWFPMGTVSSSIVVTPSATTCYTLVGYSCFQTASAVRCVTVSPSLPITISGNNATVCPGAGATLTALGATSYTWYTSMGTFTGSTIVLSPTATACYSLIASNSNGCMGYSGGCVFVSTVTPNPVISSNNFNICPGSTTTLTASGATTYTWFPSGIVSHSIAVSPTATTCYTLVGYTCYQLASAVRCVTVSPNNNVPITVSGNNTICAGGGATLTASGASTYTWLTAFGTFTGSTIVLSATATTCYSLMATNAGGCMGYTGGCVYVSNMSPNPVISSNNFNICAGQSATLTASGASSYTWFPMGTVAQSIAVTPSTTTCYTLVGYSCFQTASAVRCVTVGTSAPLTVTGNTAICAGGGATLTASGANTYTWYTSMGTFTGSTIVLSPSATACYSLIGTSSGGCMGYAGGCVTVMQGAPNPVISSNNFNICAGSSTTLTASGASTYTWFPMGTVSPSIVVSPTATTCYTLVGYSCFQIASAVRCVTVGTSAPLTVIGNTAICAGGGATLSASGANTYTWYTSMGTFTGSTIVLSPSATACYSLIGTTSGGCMGYAGGCVTVMQGAPNPVISSNNFNICAGSSTTLTASGASTYTWFPMGTVSPSIVVSPTATTCYTLVGYSCFQIASAVRCVTVGTSAPLTVSGNTAICAGGGATLSASGANTYTWYTSMGTFTGSTIVLSPSATACYSLIGTTSGGCMGYAGGCVTVMQGAPTPVISSNNFNICAGQTAVLFASGASTYTWFPGGIVSPSIAVTPSASTCYTLVGYSCFQTASAVRCVTVGSSSNITVSGSSVACFGQPVTFTASGASSYTWLPSNTTGAVLSFTAGGSTCYTVLGNSGGCTGSALKCLSVTPGPTLSIAGTNVLCGGSSASLIASGATTYTWLPGNINGPGIVINPSVSTCYTVVGTNNSGCIGIANHCVQVAPKPVIVTSSAFFCAGQPGTLVASGANTYTWLPFNLSGSSIVITPTAGGCYTVMGTSTSGCTNSSAGCYSVLPSSTIAVSGNGTICAGGSTTLVASGASSYTWLPGGLTGAAIVVSPTATTCYTVIASNGNCTSAGFKCVVVQSGAQLGISGTNLLCAGSSANLLASGALTYTWNTGSNSPFITVTPTASTCYTVTGTTAGGCIGSAVKCISVQATPTITVTGTGPICAGSAATVFASGASSYVWSNGSTSNPLVVAPAVSTVYTVTGSNGVCSSSRVFSIGVNPTPVVHITRIDSTSNDSSIVCAGSPVSLIATGASSYTWSNGATGPFITVSPTVTTTYIAFGSNASGCMSNSMITILVAPCTGLAKISGNHEIAIGIYPNPSAGQLILQGNGTSKVSYTIYDVLGREMTKGDFINAKQLDLSGYVNGTYIIRLESGNASTYKKLVLEK